MVEEEKSATAKTMDGNEAAAETAEPAEEGLAIVPTNEPAIRDLIYTVRDTQVMLDSDLAILYGVETKALNQAVARNPKRFPERFCFRLTSDEAEDLRSQIVTLHPELGKQSSWWRYLPRVFTEQGVSMPSKISTPQMTCDCQDRRRSVYNRNLSETRRVANRAAQNQPCVFSL